MFVIDKGALGPQLSGDSLSSQQFARPLQEHAEYLKGLGV
jgi:hypothetical protein